MAEETIRLHHPAFPEPALSVRSPERAVITVEFFFAVFFARSEIPGKVRPSSGVSAVFHGSAAGMAPAAGHGGSLAFPFIFAATDPVVGG